jgi:hypothetical protein
MASTLIIIPAYNEEGSLGALLEEIAASGLECDTVVVDDGSRDRTALEAMAHDVTVVRNPFNLGIGGAMQTGYRYAFVNGYDIAIQVDADGQHPPAAIPELIEPIMAGRADMTVGTRFREDTAFRGSRIRRVGIAMFASVVSLIVRQRMTDTTSGFRAANRKVIQLFAYSYPSDYPEVETTAVVHRQGLRIVEVPVVMRLREVGESSITLVWSVYYVVKVLLALFIGLFRRPLVLPPDPYRPRVED